MGTQAARISHSAREEIKIEAACVIDRPQRGCLQCTLGESVSRMASGLDRAGPSGRFIDEALGWDDPIDNAHALSGGEIVNTTRQLRRRFQRAQRDSLPRRRTIN